MSRPISELFVPMTRADVTAGLIAAALKAVPFDGRRPAGCTCDWLNGQACGACEGMTSEQKAKAMANEPAHVTDKPQMPIAAPNSATTAKTARR